MPRYFFDVAEGFDRADDPEGEELPDLDSARRAARASARELICQDLRVERSVDDRVLSVRDTSGTILFSVAVADAFRIHRSDD